MPNLDDAFPFSGVQNCARLVKRGALPWPGKNRCMVPRGAFPVLNRQRHIAAGEVVPAIADHLGHRGTRLRQAGRQYWPCGRLR